MGEKGELISLPKISISQPTPYLDLTYAQQPH